MSRNLRANILLLAFLLAPLAARAHVGSPDVYYDGYAGPYHLLVIIRPPAVIPGVAEIQIHSDAPDVSQIEILPLRMTGIAAKLAPRPDLTQRSQTDPQVFNGSLWLMTRGPWKVQIKIDGQRGKADLAVPVVAVSGASGHMHKMLGMMLAVLGVFLVAGMVGIIGAANREADVTPGEQPSDAKKNRARIAMAAMAVLILMILFYANRWWDVEAVDNARLAYKLPHLQSSLTGNLLQLRLEAPEGHSISQFQLASPDRLRLDDLIPDHGHLMHLFLIRMPDMKSFWHLHPEQTSAGEFSQALPNIPAGHYQLYADIVHHTGFAETQVGEIDLPGIAGTSSNQDDAGIPDLFASDKVSQLSNGYRMVWERDPAPLKAKEAMRFRFRIEDRNGNPATGLENYMGMAGHAVFLSNDGKVFAHVHPAGSVSMAAAELAQNGASEPAASMAAMHRHDAPLSAEVSFPYGFPQPGDYHIFVQVKRSGRVETGVFVAHVSF